MAEVPRDLPVIAEAPVWVVADSAGAAGAVSAGVEAEAAGAEADDADK